MINKIDKRKKYVLVLDTETTNNIFTQKENDGLVYDLGFGVYDKQGNEYESYSLVITDIFDNEKQLMETAYYHEKLPQYYEELESGIRQRKSIFQAKKLVREVMRKYNIKEVYAYNMSFDYNTLNNTLRYVSKSKIRYFFPFGTQVCCIWHMACQVLATQKTFLKENVVNAKGNYITNAERLYHYITKDYDFKEKHTGLEDVRIESKILTHCFKQHKKMSKKIFHNCWNIPNIAKQELLQVA